MYAAEERVYEMHDNIDGYLNQVGIVFRGLLRLYLRSRWINMMVIDPVMSKVSPPTIRYKKLVGNADITLNQVLQVFV